MKMNNKKSKKKNSISPKFIKTLFIALALLIICAGVTAAILYNKRKHQDETVRIGFYKVSKDFQNIIIDQYKNDLQFSDLKFQFSEITDEDLKKKENDLLSATKKYDLLFTWEGSDSAKLLETAAIVPDKALAQLPSAIRRNKEKYIPVLLDHFEFDFYLPVTDSLKLEIPETFTDLQNYLEKAKDYVFCPFFCNGSDDRTFLALFTVIAESLGGKECYTNLINLISTSDDFDSIFDTKIGSTGKDDISLRYISNIFRSWQKNGITHPQWCNASLQDVNFFMEDKQIAVLFTSLQEHRTFKYIYISNFTETRFPYENFNASHGDISPALICIPLSKNMNNKNLILDITSAEKQSILSQLTMLAPTHSRAECYDKQADDVRFWAASCPEGPLPDLYLAVFQNSRDEEKMKSLCTYIRNYLLRQ